MDISNIFMLIIFAIIFVSVAIFLKRELESFNTQCKTDLDCSEGLKCKNYICKK